MLARAASQVEPTACHRVKLILLKVRAIMEQSTVLTSVELAHRNEDHRDLFDWVRSLALLWLLTRSK